MKDAEINGNSMEINEIKTRNYIFLFYTFLISTNANSELLKANR